MEDKKTTLGIMEFAPISNKVCKRSHWTYATNGMSERRMPCKELPHGKPEHRTELIAFSKNQVEWIVSLLTMMAHYPFLHRSGFAPWQTIPVNDPEPHLWDGYLLALPFAEPEEFNPLPVDIGIGEDWVFHLQVIGLKHDELDYAIQHGGEKFAEQHLRLLSPTRCLPLTFLDCDRKSLLKSSGKK